MFSVPRHSATIMNSVFPSSPPSMQAKQLRSSSIVCSTCPPSRTRTQVGLPSFVAEHQTAPSASRQIPSPPWPSSSHTRRFDRLPSAAMSNRRVWDELGQGGDGICLDAEGAVWSSATKDGKPTCVRVREGGQVLQTIELDRSCFACMLGGEDGKTLFMMAAEWRGTENMDVLLHSHTGQVLTTPAPSPHAGWP